MGMIHTMRWFGPNDPVSLSDIMQAGCSGVVSALHQIPVGQAWEIADIKYRQNLIEQQRYLKWEVVESLPVHEAIKKGLPEREQFIQNYQQSIRNLAACGIYTVCYNFMPVLDWSRTDLNFEMPDGSQALRFVLIDFALFDLFILQRPGAEADYRPAVISAARQKFKTASPKTLETLTNTILLGLPGSEEAFSLASFQSLLDQYKFIGDRELRENLYYFIQQVAPVAEQVGVRLCIHPDDPPWPLLGLPRIVSSEADIQQLFKAYDSVANGLTFCTGSLGLRPDNDLPGIVKRLGNRIHFIHLRTTKREADPDNFHEADHLAGDVDMYAVVKAIIEEQNRRKAAGELATQIPMRPDHGHQMLDDLWKKTYPGYSAIGRLRGLAELRGLEMAIERFNQQT